MNKSHYCSFYDQTHCCTLLRAWLDELQVSADILPHARISSCGYDFRLAIAFIKEVGIIEQVEGRWGRRALQYTISAASGVLASRRTSQANFCIRYNAFILRVDMLTVVISSKERG